MAEAQPTAFGRAQRANRRQAAAFQRIAWGWQKLSLLLDELLDVDLEQREQRLSALKRSDPSTAAALIALLSADAAAEREGLLGALNELSSASLEG